MWFGFNRSLEVERFRQIFVFIRRSSKSLTAWNPLWYHIGLFNVLSKQCPVEVPALSIIALGLKVMYFEFSIGIKLVCASPLTVFSWCIMKSLSAVLSGLWLGLSYPWLTFKPTSCSSPTLSYRSYRRWSSETRTLERLWRWCRSAYRCFDCDFADR